MSTLFLIKPTWQNAAHYIRPNKLLLPQSRANKCSNSLAEMLAWILPRVYLH